jgi:hypothetical protein
MFTIGRQRTLVHQFPREFILNGFELPDALMADNMATRERRGLAAAFTLCALASLTLLANHPSGTTGGLAAFIKEEAAHQLVDGIVHGGFIVTLNALMICFVLLARILGSARVSVVIGLVCFCTGCAALIASMILDGFATPAIAVRFAGSDDLQPVKALLILIGTLIRFLMPMGVLFQWLAILSWSLAFVKGPGLRRAVGAAGVVTAIILIVAIFVVPAAAEAHVILGSVVLQSIWYLTIAALLFNRRSWPIATRSMPA